MNNPQAIDQIPTADGIDLGQRMMGMITSYWVTQMVRTAVEFGLPERLLEQPMTAQALAEAEGLDVDATKRFLRACASQGLTTVDDDGRFASTPLLDLLRKDNPQSLRGFALALASPGHWKPWGHMPEAVRAGAPQTIPVLGAAIFEYYQQNPVENEAFTNAMRDLTAAVSAEVARLLDTNALGHAVDVGGAGGALLIALLEANRDLRGTVFDRPDVVPEVPRFAAAAGVQDRTAAVGGDFFEEVPSADLYLLKYILHDWNDEQCVEILRNCRRSAPPGARIAIIELLVGPANEPGLAPLMDMNMLVMATGRERTLDEYRILLAKGGWGDVQVIKTETPFVILDAVAQPL